MNERRETITLTLHWLAEGRELAANVVCEDGPPAVLLPLLLRGCGLPAADVAGRARPYALRPGSPTSRPLRPDEAVGRQGVRSGAHLWLTEGSAPGQRRCVLTLPDGSELLLPRAGAELTRGWLLQALALLNPEAHRQELARLERRESSFRYASSRPHCAIAPAPGGFTLSTARADVLTLLNGATLSPHAPAALRDGDTLTLGEGGLPLGIALLGE
jgi:hypothetical protein